MNRAHRWQAHIEPRVWRLGIDELRIVQPRKRCGGTVWVGRAGVPMIHNPEVGREYRVLPNDAFVPVGATAVVVRIVEETGLPLCRVETAFGVRLVALTPDSIDELVGEPVTRQKLPRSRAVYGERSPAGWRRPHSEDTKNRMRETWTPERRARQAEMMRERKGVVITAEQVEQCRALRRSGLAIKAIAAEMGVPKYRVLVMLEGADTWTRI